MLYKNKKYIILSILFLLIPMFIVGCNLFPYGSLYINSIPAGARIFIDGIDTGLITPAQVNFLEQGSHTILLTLDNPYMSSTESIVVEQRKTTTVNIELLAEAKYRALCIGIDKYKHPAIMSLNAPAFDVERMYQIFSNGRFGDRRVSFSSIKTLIGPQATKSGILEGINSTFSTAGENDISYLYFSGHGWNESGISTIVPYDATEDTSSYISTNELASILGNIPGIKVVILDACYSGGFIGKDLSSRNILDKKYLQDINTNIVESFIGRSQLMSMTGKSNLAGKGFQVITSASGSQQCFETIKPHPVDGQPYGYFTAYLCEGCGYDRFIFPYPADSNKDRKITLYEVFKYVTSSLSFLEQDAQLYPTNSPFAFLEY